jgi:hypothetical protein
MSTECYFGASVASSRVTAVMGVVGPLLGPYAREASSTRASMPWLGPFLRFASSRELVAANATALVEEPLGVHVGCCEPLGARFDRLEILPLP